MYLRATVMELPNVTGNVLVYVQDCSVKFFPSFDYRLRIIWKHYQTLLIFNIPSRLTLLLFPSMHTGGKR